MTIATITTMTMMMVVVVVVMMMTTTARILLSSLIDEVDDAGSRVRIARTVHNPGTGKSR
jgi:hypothetical protein